MRQVLLLNTVQICFLYCNQSVSMISVKPFRQFLSFATRLYLILTFSVEKVKAKIFLKTNKKQIINQLHVRFEEYTVN
jgi:hypothetical protein